MKLELFDGDEHVVTITSDHDFEFELSKSMTVKYDLLAPCSYLGTSKAIGQAADVDENRRFVYAEGGAGSYIQETDR